MTVRKTTCNFESITYVVSAHTPSSSGLTRGTISSCEYGPSGRCPRVTTGVSVSLTEDWSVYLEKNVTVASLVMSTRMGDLNRKEDRDVDRRFVCLIFFSHFVC